MLDSNSYSDSASLPLKKFRYLAGLYIENDNIEELIKHIENLEQENTMANVLSLVI